jgi:hypothetical protein
MIRERVAPLLAEAEASLDAANATRLTGDGRALTLIQAAELASAHALSAGTRP